MLHAPPIHLGPQRVGRLQWREQPNNAPFPRGTAAMRISAIPQIYRNVNRWGEILSVLSRYELAGWIGRVGPDFAKDFFKAPGGTAIARHSWETRVRLALVELGPTFIKLGQILSTRPDLVGVRLADELQHLQTRVEPDPPALVRQLVERELGSPVDEVFAEFDDVAMASASIGQVHRARLKTGERVVVKVQHADIQRKVEVDLEILGGLAQLAERIPEFRNFRPQATVAEFQRALWRELDFRREERNMQVFERFFTDNPTIHIPKAFPAYSSSRVLTMEFIEGIPIAETQRLRDMGLDLDAIARHGAFLCLEMIFRLGFYHADPHPGNIIVMEQNVIGLIDFGMVGRIDEELHEQVGEMLTAIVHRDHEQLSSIITRIGAVPAGLDRASLEIDVADFVDHYGSLSLAQFDLSGALIEMTEMIRRYRIMLPARLAMLIKVLISLEGTARLISPQFSLVEVMGPYRHQALMRRISPRRKIRKIMRVLTNVTQLLEVVPVALCEIVNQVQQGKFDIHLNHRGLEPSVNRLVLGLLTAALFVGSSTMTSANVLPVWGVSLPGAIGCAVSFLMGVRLWLAIKRSGRLDQRRQE